MTSRAECDRVSLYRYNAVLADDEDKFKEHEAIQIIAGSDSSVTAAIFIVVRHFLFSVSILPILQDAPIVTHNALDGKFYAHILHTGDLWNLTANRHADFVEHHLNHQQQDHHSHHLVNSFNYFIYSWAIRHCSFASAYLLLKRNFVSFCGGVFERLKERKNGRKIVSFLRSLLATSSLVADKFSAAEAFSCGNQAQRSQNENFCMSHHAIFPFQRHRID